MKRPFSFVSLLLLSTRWWSSNGFVVKVPPLLGTRRRCVDTILWLAVSNDGTHEPEEGQTSSMDTDKPSKESSSVKEIIESSAAVSDKNGVPEVTTKNNAVDNKNSSKEPSSSAKVAEVIRAVEKENFPDAEFLEFSLAQHRPLGCTVEEILAHPMEKFVFVSKVAEGGFAEEAGVQVGDVLVSVSGIFDDLACVMNVGIEQVRSLVRGSPEDEPLRLRVARGTDVLDQHESAIVDLCMTPGANDEELDECITNIMAAAYTDEDDDGMMSNCDDETECMLDDLFDMWSQDMPERPTLKPDEDEIDEVKEPTIAPWSSRSSPSGTYVRDPATGEMKNIDGKQ